MAEKNLENPCIGDVRGGNGRQRMVTDGKGWLKKTLKNSASKFVLAIGNRLASQFPVASNYEFYHLGIQQDDPK